MKRISAVIGLGIFLLVTISKSKAQTNTAWQTKEIAPYHVAVAYAKTTNIIFPYSIISVDIGSSDVLAQKAVGAENILQIKAAKDSFPQTNLSIITADGKFTSFLVNYAEQPSVLNLSLTALDEPKNTINPSKQLNQEQLTSYALAASKSKKKIRKIKDKSFGIQFKLSGIFIHDEIMLFRFNISNSSNITYDIDQLRFYIRDQKKSKRTASQEIEINPVYVQNSTCKVAKHSAGTLVFVVSKFTIPDKKYLAIQLMEKNGGRHLALRAKNRAIMKAVPVN